jgi:hypothetical protein
MSLPRLVAIALIAALPSVALSASPSAPAAATAVVERTYLKANVGERERLAKFIVANWFEMDRIGLAEGLFTNYRLYENPATDADWDLVVAVGYPTPLGYGDPKVSARFGQIRAAHRTVLIDGKRLADLGKIVRTERSKPRERHN